MLEKHLKGSLNGTLARGMTFIGQQMLDDITRHFLDSMTSMGWWSEVTDGDAPFSHVCP
jgi:hypothetical protein